MGAALRAEQVERLPRVSTSGPKAAGAAAPLLAPELVPALSWALGLVAREIGRHWRADAVRTALGTIIGNGLRLGDLPARARAHEHTEGAPAPPATADPGVPRPLDAPGAPDSAGVRSFRQLKREHVETWERALIEEQLARHGWNQSHAAKALQISRRRLVEKIRRYKLLPPGGLRPRRRRGPPP